MGGMFSYTLACKIPDKIAAIAPGNGYPLGGLFGCSRARPVPIFHMHGTADDFVAYSGIHAFLGTRVSEYGCPTAPERTEPYPPGNPGSRSFKEYWGPCVNGSGQTSEVVLVSVTGMIHDWATAGKPNANEDPEFNGKPFDIDGSEEAWAFLKTHSLDDSDPGGVVDAVVPVGSGGEPATGGATGSGGSPPPPSHGGVGGSVLPAGGSVGAGATPSTIGTGGTPGIVGANGGAFAADPSDPGGDSSTGCSCRVGRRSAEPRGWSTALLGLLVALRLRTRQARKN
jgi:MYXO-CTERM domain-containing protein